MTLIYRGPPSSDCIEPFHEKLVLQNIAKPYLFFGNIDKVLTDDVIQLFGHCITKWYALSQSLVKPSNGERIQ